MQLDRIKFRPHGKCGCGCKFLDGGGDIRRGHRAGKRDSRHQPVLVDSERRPDRAPSRQSRVPAEVAAVAELDRHRGALRVHGVGQLAQLGNDLRAHVHLFLEGAAVRRHRTIRDGRHPDSAGGQIAMMADQRIGRHAIGRHALVGGRLDHPVAQLQRAKPRRTEHFACGIHKTALIRNRLSPLRRYSPTRWYPWTLARLALAAASSTIAISSAVRPYNRYTSRSISYSHADVSAALLHRLRSIIFSSTSEGFTAFAVLKPAA